MPSTPTPGSSKASPDSPHAPDTPGTADAAPADLLCFSHLRWHFVTQRPQHLLTRAAREMRVFFWEEPLYDAAGEPSLEVLEEPSQKHASAEGRVTVLRPHLLPGSDADAVQRVLLADLLRERQITRYVAWYYTPMALGFTAELQPEATVYDCMDELSGFLHAPRELRDREQALFRAADVVFTGGMSLYESKRRQHGNVHAFPSSIDVAHFRGAPGESPDPADQTAIPHPRAGFYGVLDERFDVALLAEVARLRPQIHFVLIGPVVKIDPAMLPAGRNLHYLGPKKYAELPAYLAGWDIATMPFALNDSTRFISPTKTPEYLAAGKPIVSTPIHDVVRGYGDEGLVAIAATAAEFAEALDQALIPPDAAWREAVEAKLATNSWDKTWAAMWGEIERVRTTRLKPA